MDEVYEGAEGARRLAVHDEVYAWLNEKPVGKEFCYCVGLIQVIEGSLSAASKKGVGVRLFLQEPETHLHPKRQSRIMSVIGRISKKYYPD